MKVQVLPLAEMVVLFNKDLENKKFLENNLKKYYGIGTYSAKQILPASLYEPVLAIASGMNNVPIKTTVSKAEHACFLDDAGVRFRTALNTPFSSATY